MPHEHLLTVQATASQPSLDALQPGAQGRGAALMTSKISAACQSHTASLRCHRRHPTHTFPLPAAYLVSKEHVIDDVIVDHRRLVHQRGDLAAGAALLNPLEQEDEPIHGAAESSRESSAPATPLGLLCPAAETSVSQHQCHPSGSDHPCHDPPAQHY